MQRHIDAIDFHPRGHHELLWFGKLKKKMMIIFLLFSCSAIYGKLTSAGYSMEVECAEDSLNLFEWMNFCIFSSYYVFELQNNSPSSWKVNPILRDLHSNMNKILSSSQ